MKVSHMAANLVGSEIIKLAAQVNERKSKGEQIYNLTIGDFDPEIFPIPEELTLEIIKAYEDHQTNYPPGNGLESLREAISVFLKEKGGLDYDANQILVSCGARPIIFSTFLTIVDPGDKVIYPVPSWNNNHYTHISGATQVMVETRPEDNFMPTADLLRPHIQGATLLALCSPLNPTGTVFSKDQLSGICEMVLEENNRRDHTEKPLYLMYDQIYWNLTHGDTQHYNPVSLYPEMEKYTIFIDGMSKAFAATGVRMGWGFGPSHVIHKMRSIVSHAGAWSPKAEQVAAAVYLSNREQVDAYLHDIRQKLEARLSGFYSGFMELRAKGLPVDAIAPQAAIYLTVRIDLKGYTKPDGHLLRSTREVTDYLLSEAQLAIVPFYAFGADEESPWYRISVGTARMEDIPVIIQKLEEAISRLQPSKVGVK